MVNLKKKLWTNASRWCNLADTSYEMFIDLTTSLKISDAGMQVEVKCASKLKAEEMLKCT